MGSALGIPLQRSGPGTLPAGCRQLVSLGQWSSASVPFAQYLAELFRFVRSYCVVSSTVLPFSKIQALPLGFSLRQSSLFTVVFPWLAALSLLNVLFGVCVCMCGGVGGETLISREVAVKLKQIWDLLHLRRVSFKFLLYRRVFS